MKLRIRIILILFVLGSMVLLYFFVVNRADQQELMYIAGIPGQLLTEPQGPQGIYAYADHSGLVPAILINEYQHSPVLSHSRQFLLFNSVDIELQSSDLFLYDMASGSIKQLTHSKEVEYSVAWSHDDRLIAYATSLDSHHRVVIDNLEGSINEIDLPTVYPPVGLAWLPSEENSIIVSLLIANASPPVKIYKINVNSNDMELISHSNSAYFAHSFSPDGTRIAYLDIASFSLIIENISENTTETMFTGLVRGFTLAWSPEGDRLAFTSVINGDGDITILNVHTEEVYTITYPGNDEFSPVWSPDGSRIVSISSLESSAQPCIFTVLPPFECEHIDIWIAPSFQYLSGVQGASVFDSQIAW